MTYGTFPTYIITSAQNAQGETTIPASVTLAQWAVESGWGAHVIGKYNYFGIKYSSHVNGLKPLVRETKEYVHGAWEVISAEFQDYASDVEAFVEHGKLIAEGRYYRFAMEFLRQKEYVQFVHEMAAHYATAPNYAQVLLRVVASWQLGQYDVPKYEGYPVLMTAQVR